MFQRSLTIPNQKSTNDKMLIFLKIQIVIAMSLEVKEKLVTIQQDNVLAMNGGMEEDALETNLKIYDKICMTTHNKNFSIL